MKNIVKIISVVLVLSILAMAFASCGSDKGLSGKFKYMSQSNDYIEFSSSNKFDHKQNSGGFLSKIPAGSGTYEINDDETKITLKYDDGKTYEYSYNYVNDKVETSVTIGGECFLK